MTTTSSPQRPAALRTASAAASHGGRVRANNQDAFLEYPDLNLWAVADGMGGLASGEVASRAVVEALASLEPGAGLADRVDATLGRVNDDLRWQAEMSEGGRMMGSTVVVLLVEERSFVCLWAGDSRLYRWRNGFLQQLTSDHTPIQGLLDAGVVRPGQAPNRALDHMISRAVGTEIVCKLDRLEGVIEPGDTFLLCTDGLSKVVDETAIGILLGADVPDEAVRHLIEAALLAGGPDNVTALIVAVGAPAPVAECRTPDRPDGGDTLTRTPGDRAGPRRAAEASVAVPAASESVLAEPEMINRHGRPAAEPRTAGERVAWFGILLALVVGLLGIGLQKTELRLQFVATIPGVEDPDMTALADVERRLILVVAAEGLLVAAALLGRAARHWPRLAPAGTAALVLGVGAAIVGLTDLGNLDFLPTPVRLPGMPLPVSWLIETTVSEIQSWRR
jgi:serine/threonine protein phosphatase PrpC